MLGDGVDRSLVAAQCCGKCRSAKEAYEKGKACLDKKDYDAAIVAFTEAIRLDPKYAVAYYDRGTAYNGKGMTDLVEASRHGNLTTAYYIAEENFVNANADFTKAIRLDQRVADVYYGRRVAYTQQGDWLPEGAMLCASYPLSVACIGESPRETATSVCPNTWGERAQGSEPSLYPAKRVFSSTTADARTAADSKRTYTHEINGEKAKADEDFNQAKKLGYKEK